MTAAEFVSRHAAADGLLIVGPTREAADEAARDASLAALAGTFRHSIRDLAFTLSEAPMLQRGLVPVRSTARRALAALVTAKVLSKLRYLQPVASFPGFARALSRTLEDLRLNEVATGDLRTIGRSGEDLALLLEAYEEELKSRRYADHAERVLLAREAVDVLGGLPLLLLDVPVRSRSEQKLIEVLKASSAEVLEVRRESREVNLQGREVDWFSASGEALECVEIVRRSLKLAGTGVGFDRIAVLMRNPSRYQPLLEEAFARAGVPVFFSRGSRRPNVSGRAFLALLRCRESNLSASRFAEYLSLGETRAPSGWERLLVDAAVIGGRDRWEQRLNGLAAEKPERREWIEDLRDFALPVIGMLDELPQRAMWGDWLERLTTLAAKTLESPESVMELLDELRPLSDVGPVELPAVIAAIADDLATQRSSPEDARYGKVFAGAIEEGRGLHFDAVFVPGLNEGLFPRQVREDPLLLDLQRNALGIPVSEDDQDLLLTTIDCALSRFIASWSRLDLQTGRERVPSFYAFAIAESVRGADLDVRTFERDASTGSAARLGWPAPVDSADAIDDAEYDLAYLRPAWQARVKGAGAYLTKVNPHVAEALRARWLRWKNGWRWPDGLVADNEIFTAGEAYRPTQTAYSPTQLERYARCPYQFLLSAVYHLHERATAEGIERMDPGLRGELYHDVQRDLLNELRDAGRLPILEDELGGVFEKLDVVLHRAAAAAAARYMPALPPVWQAGVDNLRADLRGWLLHMVSADKGWTPEAFEREFQDVRVLDEYLLKGRIDLVERHMSGRLRVTDHKTGNPPKNVPQTIGGGQALQPVLYALALEQLSEEEVKGGRLFYSTLRQNFSQISIELSSLARGNAGRVFKAVDASLRNGFFPAMPAEDACDTCDYLPVCGPYEEERTRRGRKPSWELHDIRKLL